MSAIAIRAEVEDVLLAAGRGNAASAARALVDGATVFAGHSAEAALLREVGRYLVRAVQVKRRPHRLEILAQNGIRCQHSLQLAAGPDQRLVAHLDARGDG